MRQLDINSRSKDAPWYEKSKEETISMIGLGGIGSNTLYYMSKTIPCKYILFDDDVVEEYNIGTQFFTKEQIGDFKVSAVADLCKKASLANFMVFNIKHTTEYTPIMITGLDNMAARKNAFEVWKSKEDRELFIDGRLRANLYEVYVVTKGREEAYAKTLFDDSEVDDGPCTFKQTAYFAGLIAGRISHVVVNYLSNKYSEDPIWELPFSIKEVGDLFYIEIKNYEEDISKEE